MPSIPMSKKCLACSSRVTYCDADCIDSLAITRIFALCHNNRVHCRHILTCKLDPRKCGYWTDRDYPIKV